MKVRRQMFSAAADPGGLQIGDDAGDDDAGDAARIDAGHGKERIAVDRQLVGGLIPVRFEPPLTDEPVAVVQTRHRIGSCRYR